METSMVNNKVIRMEKSVQNGISNHFRPKGLGSTHSMPKKIQLRSASCVSNEPRCMQEYLRAFVQQLDKKMTSKTRDHINKKVDRLIELLQSLSCKLMKKNTKMFQFPLLFRKREKKPCSLLALYI